MQGTQNGMEMGRRWSLFSGEGLRSHSLSKVPRLLGNATLLCLVCAEMEMLDLFCVISE